MKKKILTLSIAAATAFNTMSFAAPFDLTHNEDATKNYGFSEFLGNSTKFNYVRDNMAKYLIEATNGDLYNAYEVNDEIEKGAKDFDEAIKNLEPVGTQTPEEKLKVESVSAINNTTIEVKLESAADATAANFTATLDGAAVEVKSAVAGAGKTVYTLVVEDLFGKKGSLTVNGVSTSIDFSEGALSLAIGAVQTANEDNIIERLNAPILNTTGVKAENAKAYVVARDNVLGDTALRIQNNIINLTNEKENKLINETYVPFVDLAQPPANVNNWTKGVVKAAEAWETAISEQGQREALTDLATSLYTLELYGLKDISSDIAKPSTKGDEVTLIASKTGDDYKILETYAKAILADKPTTLVGVQAVIDSSLDAAELERKAKETVQEFEDLEAATTSDGSYTNTQTAQLAQESLVKANGLVAQLPAGDTKTDLEGRINTAKTSLDNKVETHAKTSVAALFAKDAGAAASVKVSNAANITSISIEDLKDVAKYNLIPTSQMEIDQALAAVELLPAATLRTSLNVRVNVAQERFDGADDAAKLSAAQTAVKGLFSSHTVTTANKSVTDVRDDVRALDAYTEVKVTSKTVIDQAASKVAKLKDSVTEKAKLQMAIDTYEELVAREAVASLIDTVNSQDASQASSIMNTTTLVGATVTWTNVNASENVKSEKSFDTATEAVNNLTNSGSLAVKTRLVTFLNAAKAEYAKHAVSEVYTGINAGNILAQTEQQLKTAGLAGANVSAKSSNIKDANKAVALVSDAGIKANLQSKVDLANVLILNIAVNTEADAVEALKTLNNDNLINLGVQGGKEASALLFAIRTDDNGADPQEFTSVVEAEETLEAVIVDYNSKLQAINEATTVAQMQTALNEVVKGYKGAADILAGDFAAKFSSSVSIADAENVLNNLKALKNPTDENIKGRSFRNLKDVVENGFNVEFVTGALSNVSSTAGVADTGSDVKSTVTVEGVTVTAPENGAHYNGYTVTTVDSTTEKIDVDHDAKTIVITSDISNTTTAAGSIGTVNVTGTNPGTGTFVFSGTAIAEDTTGDTTTGGDTLVAGTKGETKFTITTPLAVGDKITVAGKTITVYADSTVNTSDADRIDLDAASTASSQATAIRALAFTGRATGGTGAEVTITQNIAGTGDVTAAVLSR